MLLALLPNLGLAGSGAQVVEDPIMVVEVSLTHPLGVLAAIAHPLTTTTSVTHPIEVAVSLAPED